MKKLISIVVIVTFTLIGMVGVGGFAVSLWMHPQGLSMSST